MKIVVLVSYTYPFVGSGLGQVALAQAEGLAKLRHKVVLVSSNIPHTKKTFKRAGVLHLKLKTSNFLNKFNIPVPLFFFNREVIKQIKTADVVHCHDMLYPYSLQGALAAKFFRKPFILTQHAGFILYPNKLINLFQLMVNKTLGRLVLKLSTRIIVVNEEVGKWLGKDGEKSITLINGVDTKLFHPVSEKRKVEIRRRYGFPINKKIVLHVGRLVEKKGFHRLYEARSQDYLTVIVGGGIVPQVMNTEKEKVLFLGALPQNKLTEIYQTSDVFVLPSDCEGFPLSIQEAMACGLPIITSNHPGFDKYLDKRYVKFINPANSELKKAIKDVLDNQDLRNRMSDYSLNITSVKTSWENNLSKLIEIYKDTLQ
jgi:D-inositol-3-phosphate glycosyltransferase